MSEYKFGEDEHAEWLDHIKDGFPEILILPSENGTAFMSLYFLPATRSVVACHPRAEIAHVIEEVTRDPEYTALDIEEALEKLGWFPANALIGPTWNIV